ncbi:MAG: tetratricopeptide repeat protein [Candidatus Acidiferrales bacterium]
MQRRRLTLAYAVLSLVVWCDATLAQAQDSRAGQVDLSKPPAARELGIAHYKSGDYARAVTYLEEAVAQSADDKEATQLLGLSYYLLGRVPQAIPLLERVQSWFPTANLDATYILGVCYIQTKDFDKARRAFAAMYGVEPESAAAHLFLARMLLRQGFDVDAEKNTHKAIELDPRLPLAHFLMGEFHMFKSRIPEAIAAFEKELALNPAHAAAHYKLADAYSRAGKWEEAHRLLQRSIWLDATATGPYVLMGKVLLKKNENELAARTLERALQMDPSNFIAHHMLGQAYRALGRIQDAERELKRAQELQSAQSPNPTP